MWNGRVSLAPGNLNGADGAVDVEPGGSNDLPRVVDAIYSTQTINGAEGVVDVEETGDRGRFEPS